MAHHDFMNRDFMIMRQTVIDCYNSMHRMSRMGVARVGCMIHIYPYALFMLHTMVPLKCHKMKSCSCEE